MTARRVVVVDGSNLATEGRTTPSLQQLDDAVRAYAAEDPEAEIVVVVDASFEHRVDASERAALEEAELHGEVVSPPAGAIGRGDAFVLRIAERTGARVLSNDSFQEFHGEHPWLFDEGRLIGGKPVPGVGWIFTPRIPVRGPKSRQATSRARRSGGTEPLSPPVKAAELAKAARKAAAARMAVLPDGSTPKVGDVWQEPAAGTASPSGAPPSPAPAPAEKATKKKAAKKAAKAKKAATDVAATGEAPASAAEPPPAKKAARATKGAKTAKKAAPAKKAAAATKATKKAAGKKAAGAAALTPAVAAPADEMAASAAAVEAVAQETLAEEEAAAVAAPASRAAKQAAAPGRARPRDDPALRDAIDEATAEALSAPTSAPPERTQARSRRRAGAAASSGVGGGGGRRGAQGGGPAEPEQDVRNGDESANRRRRRRAATSPPAVNEPLAFITFVATYPVGSEVEGEVVSFTSHGAMVDVDLPDGGILHCYIPLTAMADPPPTKARQVLSRGERRSFVLVGLDPPRRVAELAVPGVPVTPLAAEVAEAAEAAN